MTDFPDPRVRSTSPEASKVASWRSAPGGAEQRQLSWQREFERAQLASWFRPDPKPQLGHQDASATTPAGAYTRMQTSCAMFEPGNLDDAPIARSGTLRAWSNPSTVSTDAQANLNERPPIGETGVASEGNGLTAPFLGTSPDSPRMSALAWLQPAGASYFGKSPEIDEAIGEPHAPADPLTQAAASRDGEADFLHVHEETMPAGQAIWLAMRADDEALAAQLPQIIRYLERVQGHQSRRLHQVVCNGQLIWRDGRFAQRAGPVSSSQLQAKDL